MGKYTKEINTEISHVLLPLTIWILVGVVLSVCGNILVMYIHWRKLKSTKNFRKCVPYLALSDCLASIFCSASSVYNNFHWFHQKSALMCKSGHFISMLLQTNSAMFLFIIGYQRYIKICYPCQKPTSRRMKAICVVSAIVFLAVESVPFFFFADVMSHDMSRVNATVFVCNMMVNYEAIHSVYRISDDVLMFFLVILIVYFYTRSGLVLSALSNKIKKSSNTPTPQTCWLMSICLSNEPQTDVSQSDSMEDASSSATVAESFSVKQPDVKKRPRHKRLSRKKCRKYRNINIMFIIITTIVIVTYTPQFVFNISELRHDMFWFYLSNLELIGLLFLRRLFLITYFINPIIYSIMDDKFRKELKKLFRFCRKSEE